MVHCLVSLQVFHHFFSAMVLYKLDEIVRKRFVVVEQRVENTRCVLSLNLPLNFWAPLLLVYIIFYCM